MSEIDPIEQAKKMAPSPCQGICRLDPRRDQCIGCYRYRKEVGRWRFMPEEERSSVIKDLPARLEEYRTFMADEGVHENFPEELYELPDRITEWSK